MFSVVRGFVLAPDETPTGFQDRLKQVDVVGYKACGLSLLPRIWTPAFLVLSAELYKQWLSSDSNQKLQLLGEAVADLDVCLSGWAGNWPQGLALRSSATSETLRDRGAYQSIELTADYGSARIVSAISEIYESFARLQSDGAIAIVIQARVHTTARGHLSNERRISKTVNQWMWENE